MNTPYSVRYIHHDCFLVRVAGTASFLFDFFKDPARGDRSEEPRFLSLCNPDEPLYILVSHHHKDHYSPEIFRWQQSHPNIRYILSKDTARFARHYLRADSIAKGPKPAAESVTTLSPGESADFGAVTVRAFPSTDIGNSYAVTLNIPGAPRPLHIFHAGDLNAWLGKAFSTEEEIRRSLRDYRGILNRIAAVCPRFDVAMFPVDARIGPGFETGAKMFLELFDVEDFFPMHFTLWENEEERAAYLAGAADFSRYASPRCRRCHAPASDYES